MSTYKSRTETRLSEGLTVYVDPYAGFLYLKVVTPESGIFQLQISDIGGKTLIEQSVPSNQLTSIPINSLIAGVYSVKVQSGDTVLNEMFRF